MTFQTRAKFGFRLVGLIAMLSATICGAARAHGEKEDGHDDGRFVNSEAALMKQVGIDQKMDAQVPLDSKWRDQTGKAVNLGDYFKERPVMLLMISYTCQQLCSTEVETLTTNLLDISFMPGRQFDIVVAGIDPRETTQMAAASRDNFLKAYKRPGIEDGVHFLTGDEASIKALASSVGYRYVWNPATKEYAHPEGVMLLTPEGKMSQYFLQFKYYDKDLRLGIVGASQSHIGTLLDYISISCWHRNPTDNKYSLKIMGVLKLAGIATLLVMALGIGLMLSNDKRRKGASGTKAMGAV